MRKTLSFLIAIMLLANFSAPAWAADQKSLDKALTETAAYMLNTVKNPEIGSVGGEWAVIGLARSGYKVSDSYYENYYHMVEKYVKEHEGILHNVKYTEYSRVILALTAAGYDPRHVAGYDLTEPLSNSDKTIWQGINGPIFALIALDSHDYSMPVCSDEKSQATRELYIEEILRRQTPDGGWNLTAGVNGPIGASEKGDADLTGMALQALAKYQDQPKVKTAVDKALTLLSKNQDKNGGYESGFSSGSSSVESAVQVLVALGELGIPADDTRFVKNSKSLVDNILSYKNTDGSFKHVYNGSGNNQMATEQALYGLVAAQRAAAGKNSLYRMGDSVKHGEFLLAEPEKPAGLGLPGKHTDVKTMPIIKKDISFADTVNHRNQAAVEALAARGIISGKSETGFEPNETITRAEFATVMVQGLGLPAKEVSLFTDISPSAWYAPMVATAYYYELVAGTSATMFSPNSSITRQEAAVMVSRAAKLCGLDTTCSDGEIRDILAQFGDYRTVADWAQSSLAFCYVSGLLDEDALDIKPTEIVKRCEVAEMLYRMLERANLL